MKNVLSLAAMMLMAVTVYAAALHYDIELLLKQIKKEADSLRNKSENLDWEVHVAKISPDDGPTCGDNFFCLAEMALPTIQPADSLDVGNLTRLLRAYNSKIENNCTLNTTETSLIQKFLGDIIICAKRKLKHHHIK